VPAAAPPAAACVYVCGRENCGRDKIRERMKRERGGERERRREREEREREALSTSSSAGGGGSCSGSFGGSGSFGRPSRRPSRRRAALFSLG